MAVIGNTIKIKAEFVTWGGSHSDIVSGNIVVYDKMRELLQTIPLTSSVKLGTGIYEVSYVVPDGYGDLTIEAIGTLENSPIVGRVLVGREWS